MFNFHLRDKTNTWPAFVDLFSNLVIILIFLLIVFVFLWTTTSVFNKSTGIKTISELKQTNAEQSEKIRQMTADAEEATQLLLTARANLESAAADLEAKDSSIVDLIGAYEKQVNQLQSQDAEKGAKIQQLTNELNDARAETQAVVAESEKISKEKTAELEKLNAALATAEAKYKEQEVQYVEMSNRLNKALADKVAELQDMGKYQSEFYKSIKLALGDTKTLKQDGDRFIVPSDILFSSGSYKLSPEGKKQLQLISNVIKDLENQIPSDIDWIIRVDGHTDKKQVVRGNAAYRTNMQLSLLRATVVANELIRNGVSPRRLVPTGFGDLHPVELGTDKASLQKNRRIELQLTNK